MNPALPNSTSLGHKAAMRRAFPFLPLILAGCVAPMPPAPPPAPATPVPTIVAAPTAPPSWEDAPPTPGSWVWHRDAQESVAMFGTPGQPALFVARCTFAERRIGLAVPGAPATDGALTIVTSDGARRFIATGDGGDPPYAGVMLPANDGFLDRIAFSRGRFQVTLGTDRPVVIPVRPEYARTIEDCRG